MNSLTPPQEAKLRSLEETIEKGLAEMGKALAEIRRTRLYRATHTTFEAYCNERWHKSVRRIQQLIAAGQVAENLKTRTNCSPSINEGQARELVGLEPEQQREVWTQASKEGTPTAERLAEVRKAVETMAPADQADAAQESRSTLLRDAGRVIDNEGRRDRLKQIDRLARRLEKITAGLGPEAEEALGHLQAFKSSIDKLDE